MVEGVAWAAAVDGGGGDLGGGRGVVEFVCGGQGFVFLGSETRPKRHYIWYLLNLK